MFFLIAYDIANPRRLQRVARVLERRAVRCQKSVFLLEGDQAALDAALSEAAGKILPSEDVVQSWKLAVDQPALGQVRGSPLQVYPAAAIVQGRHCHLVSQRHTGGKGRAGDRLP